MASTPRPTKQQLRQHALDRALTDAMVNRIATGIGDDMHDPEPEVLAEGIITVAKAFEEYLYEPEQFDEGVLAEVYEALIAAGISERQATDAVNQMQNRGILFSKRS